MSYEFHSLALMKDGEEKALIGAERIPGRKGVALVGHIGTPGALTVLAYFRNEESAELFLLLAKMLVEAK